MSTLQRLNYNPETNHEIPYQEFQINNEIDHSINGGGYFNGPATQNYDKERLLTVIGYKDPEKLVTTILEEIGIIPTNEDIFELEQKIQIQKDQDVLNGQISNLNSISNQLKEYKDIRDAIKIATNWYDINIKTPSGKLDLDKLDYLHDISDEFHDCTLLTIIRSLKNKENEQLVIEADRIARVLVCGIAYKDQKESS